MRQKHTKHISLSSRSMDFKFFGYQIIVDFSNRLPRPEGDWLPISLFCIDEDYSFLLLKHSFVGSFWMLGADFNLLTNEHEAMQRLLKDKLASGRHDDNSRALIFEVEGLISYFDKKDQTAFEAFMNAHDRNGLQDAESYSALIDVASRLGKLADALPIVEIALEQADLFSLEQAAIPRAWLGRLYASRSDFVRGHTSLVAALAGHVVLPDWLPGTLDWCARQDMSEAFGHPPISLLNEVELFGLAAHAFLDGQECTWNSGRYPTITVARQWVHRMVKVVHLMPNDAEALELLRAGGLSPIFLAAATRGRDGVGEACFAACPDVPFASDPAISLRVKEVAATVLLGGKPVLCPFTGDRDLARDTINLHTFLHRKNGRTCIIFSDPDISIAPSDSAWYFPDLGILLTVGWNMRPKTALATTLQRVLDNLQQITAYISSSERSIMISEERMGHIGHYIWNVISGWRNLLDIVDIRDIDIITSYQDGHFFGGVTELYEDEIEPVASILKITSQEDAYATMLKHRSISLVLRDRHVTQDVASRVQTWCHEHVSTDFLNLRATFRKAANPVIMLTIRIENRAWMEQEIGFIEIIKSLKAEYPRLGVIIDGLNAPPAGTTTFAPMSLADEQAVAERIIAACPTVQFINAVGCTPAEGVLWCAIIEAFVAPIGAGLAKSRWIANKPGVGFSNETFLVDGHFEGYLYSHFRESASTMLYVARHHVSDVDVGHHGQVGRANFSMDWRAPLAELRTCLLARERQTA